MPNRALTIVLICATTVSGTLVEAAERVIGWPGGAANVMTYGHDAPIGRIQEDGTITFDLPTPSEANQTVSQTFDRCRTTPLTVENGAARVMPTMLYVELGDSELSLVAASSPEMAAWSLSFGESPLVKGSHLRWLHVDGAASVTGDCVETMLTPSGDLAFRNTWQLQLTPGWNLIRTTFVEVVEHADGSRHETHTIHDALPALPEDAHWYLEGR
jgi:hypothetical protein